MVILMLFKDFRMYHYEENKFRFINYKHGDALFRIFSGALTIKKFFEEYAFFFFKENMFVPKNHEDAKLQVTFLV